MSTSNYNADQADALRRRGDDFHRRADQLHPRPGGEGAPVDAPDAGCSSRVVIDFPGGARLVVHATGISDGLFACVLRDLVGALHRPPRPLLLGHEAKPPDFDHP